MFRTWRVIFLRFCEDVFYGRSLHQHDFSIIIYTIKSKIVQKFIKDGPGLVKTINVIRDNRHMEIAISIPLEKF